MGTLTLIKVFMDLTFFKFLLLLFLPDVDSPYASKTVLQVIRSD